jgi:hypothetical protein
MTMTVVATAFAVGVSMTAGAVFVLMLSVLGLLR